MPLRSKTRAEKLRAQVGGHQKGRAVGTIVHLSGHSAGRCQNPVTTKRQGSGNHRTPFWAFCWSVSKSCYNMLQQKVGRFSDSSDKKNVLRTLQSRQANFWRLRKPIARNPLRIAEQLSGEEVIASFFSTRKRRGGITLFSWPLSRHWNTC